MKLEIKCCYSRLLWIMCAGEPFQQSVSSIKFTEPRFDFEGMAGYIETIATIEIKDITKFAALWDSYNSLTDMRRCELYGLAKGLGDCK